MAPVSNNKRGRAGDDVRRPKKKIKVRRKQTDYHSSSEDDEDDPHNLSVASKVAEHFAPLPTPKSILKPGKQATNEMQELSGSELEDAEDVDELERNTALNAAQDGDGEEDEDINETRTNKHARDQSDSASSDEDPADSDSEAASTSTTDKTRKKRNNPTAFAESITRILSTKLTTTKRPDPILSRSKAASETHKALAENKLEQKARSQLQAEKKAALQKGRVVDVLELDNPDVDTGRIQEEEKRLKKIAQRGVVRLFNAVRAAQVKAEEAARQARAEGVVGRKQKDERVNEMSREGFLELIKEGGRGGVAS